MKANITAIVPAAGLGKRFDKTIRKTFAGLKGIPLLVHTLKRLQREDSIKEIIPSLREEDIERGLEMARQYGLDKITRIACGGDERQDSIYNALKLIEDRESLVLIHDGVRPYIPEGAIEELIKGLEGLDGIAPGIPVKETLKEIDGESNIISTVDREKIRAIQTPQVFPFSIIKNAYEQAYKEGFLGTDDASLVERAGGKIRILPGSPYNIKVTTPEDLEMLEHITGREYS